MRYLVCSSFNPLSRKCLNSLLSILLTALSSVVIKYLTSVSEIRVSFAFLCCMNCSTCANQRNSIEISFVYLLASPTLKIFLFD